MLPGKEAVALGTGIFHECTSVWCTQTSLTDFGNQGAEIIRIEDFFNIRGTPLPITPATAISAISDCKWTIAGIARYLKASHVDCKTQRVGKFDRDAKSTHSPLYSGLAPYHPFPLPSGYHRKNRAQFKPQRPVEERLQTQ